MDLRHLRHFVAVAEEQHFGRAAARLGIEQSPLSRSIRELEGHLQAPLLTRSPRGSQLTAAGTALVAPARAILAQAAGLRATVAHARTAASRRLRLGVCDAVATAPLTACLSALRVATPDLRIEIVSLPSGEAAAAVDDGTVDAAMALSPTASSTLTSTTVWTERFVAMVGQLCDPDRREPPVEPTELLRATEVLAADAWAAAAERWLRTLAAGTPRVAPPVRLVGTLLALVTTVATQPGIALLPKGLAGALAGRGVAFRKVAGPSCGLAVVLLHRPDRDHSGLETLQAVIRTRPWTIGSPTAAAVPAGTRGRGP